MTAARLQTVFASLDPPQAWPATRGRPQPQRLELGLEWWSVFRRRPEFGNVKGARKAHSSVRA